MGESMEFSYHVTTATTIAKISDDKRQLSDDEALCLSTQHIHIASHDVDEANRLLDDSLGGSSPRPFFYEWT